MGLLAALVAWAAAAPLIWILRDGLGPDAADTTGLRAVSKFAVAWGLPALVSAASVVGLSLIHRRFRGDALSRAAETAWQITP
jgi:hypothetical protein